MPHDQDSTSIEGLPGSPPSIPCTTMLPASWGAGTEMPLLRAPSAIAVIAIAVIATTAPTPAILIFILPSLGHRLRGPGRSPTLLP